ERLNTSPSCRDYSSCRHDQEVVDYRYVSRHRSVVTPDSTTAKVCADVAAAAVRDRGVTRCSAMMAGFSSDVRHPQPSPLAPPLRVHTTPPQETGRSRAPFESAGRRFPSSTNADPKTQFV
ncbi:unnamed protein product, partial [Sphacelaria rigidula]